MTEHDKLERYERSRPNGSAAESRVVKVADSYEILEPQEAPDFRAYARILRKRLPTILIVFFILFGIGLIATLKQGPIYRAQVLLEIQKENPDIPTIKELYELETVSDEYLRTQYSILASESLARRAIEQVHLETLHEFNSRRWWQLCPETRKPSTTQTFADGRSEEHTSELQSPCNLVCRLLLEKKKKQKKKLVKS